MFILLCIFKAFATVSGAGGAYGTTWRYGDILGPSTWKEHFTECGWSNQSPINIRSGDVEVDTDLGTLELGRYDRIENVTFVMKNRNTDVEFKAQADTKLPKDVPQTIKFKGATYRLYQFHFHWGSKSQQGSEHQLDSQQYAAEMHIIHYNDKYNNVGEAVNASDGLLVWGHFLQVTSENDVENTYFKTIANKIAGVRRAEDGVQSVQINLRKLLPVNVEKKFYHYKGSLTTPPCHQSVNWIVSPRPIRVSEKLMNDNFRVLVDKAMTDVTNKDTSLVDNYRPVQPLNGRTVYSNFHGEKEGSCSHGKEKRVHYMVTPVHFESSKHFISYTVDFE